MKIQVRYQTAVLGFVIKLLSWVLIVENSEIWENLAINWLTDG